MVGTARAIPAETEVGALPAYVAASKYQNIEPSNAKERGAFLSLAGQRRAAGQGLPEPPVAVEATSNEGLGVQPVAVEATSKSITPSWLPPADGTRFR